MKRSYVKKIFFSVFCLFIFSCATSNHSPAPQECRKPFVMGHRGASGYAPEHTLRSYELALDQGADYIEPDLVMSKEGVLIVRHENEISETTDVEKKFPHRKKAVKNIDGIEVTGWFTEDFTWAELQKLRAKERLSYRSHTEDGKHKIVSFEEFLKFTVEQEKKSGHTIGIIPEIKHSTYFEKIGLPMEDKVVQLLKKYKKDRRDSKVIIQSFEVDNLKKLRLMIDVDIVQLLDESGVSMATLAGFKEMRQYADWVSPHKSFIVQVGADGEIKNKTSFVTLAHEAGLKVVPYTFRSDTQNLAKAYKGNPANEYQLFFDLGVEGVFSDFPDHAVKAVQAYYITCKSNSKLFE